MRTPEQLETMGDNMPLAEGSAIVSALAVVAEEIRLLRETLEDAKGPRGEFRVLRVEL